MKDERGSTINGRLSESIARLLEEWRDAGVVLFPAPDRSAVVERQSATGKKFSGDVLDLYCATGGMDFMDTRLFSLWPLDVLVAENVHYPGRELFFGDFLINSHQYCFRFESESRSSVQAYWGEFEQVASSVAEFFETMLTNPGRLMLMDDDSHVRRNITTE